MSVIAQNAPVRGEVKLQKPDGTVVPVEGAIVEAFRTDIGSGKMPEAKTNKRGEFNFVGFPLGQRYVLTVSGAGIGPKIQPDVKAGMERIVFVVNEGDGRRLTETEARDAAAAAANLPAGGAAEVSEAQKKEQEELQKKNAAILESNKKAEDANKVVNASLKAGAAAFTAKNYELAIVEFEKGIAADPDFEGSAPVLLNYKGVALQQRALATFNAAAAGDPSGRAAAIEKSKPDLVSAIAAFNRGLEILKNAPAPSAADQGRFNVTKTQLLTNLLDTHGLAARISPDPAREALAPAVFDQYLAVETDSAKRKPIILAYADRMNGAGELKPATVAYRKVLEDDPNNLDALAGLGLALYSIGYDPPNKEVLQEGLNYMQRFVDAAPNDHKLKDSTKAIIEELKNDQKLAPQKTAPARRRG